MTFITCPFYNCLAWRGILTASLLAGYLITGMVVLSCPICNDLPVDGVLLSFIGSRCSSVSGRVSVAVSAAWIILAFHGMDSGVHQNLQFYYTFQDLVFLKETKISLLLLPGSTYSYHVVGFMASAVLEH